MTDPIYYGKYLQLDKLLDAQELESGKHGEPVHDEMLFIVVHQAYELWFKQIIWELDSIIELFDQEVVDERDMGNVVARLRRVSRIQALLINQISVLETMTPLDFLDFRDYLVPASGFQSAQFRIVENKLGLRPEDRLLLGGAQYTSRLSEHDQGSVQHTESETSLFDGVERWLERTPFLDHEDFQFWDAYRGAVLARIEADRSIVANNPNLGEEERTAQLKEFDQVLAQNDAIFDSEKFELERSAGRLRLGHRAFQAALFITLYRDQPALQEAFRMIELLMDIDEGFTTWRYRHAQMALRMIGRRIGTGGSAGAKYLERSAERSRVFADFFSLSTFLVPRADRPELPEAILTSMQYRFDT